MRSFVIVVPDKVIDRTASRGKRKQGPDVQALVVDGSKESLDFPVGLRGVRAQEVVPDAVGRADLLKSRLPVGVVRVPHCEGQGVIREDCVDAVRQGGQDVLQEGRGGSAGLVGLNRDDRFAAEIIDSREFEVIPSISERRQVFEVEMQQLTRPLFLVAFRLGARRTRQLVEDRKSTRLNSSHSQISYAVFCLKK